VQIGFGSNSPIPTPPRIAGTGFIVNKKGYVLTAAHVITEAEAALRAEGATKTYLLVSLSLDASSTPNLQFRGSFRGIVSTVVDIDEEHDVALLKLSQNPFAPGFSSGIAVGSKLLPISLGIVKLNPNLPSEGQSVLISGYPLENPTLVSQKGMVASESYQTYQKHPPGSPEGFTVPESKDIILLDAVVNPGNSGGPVYLPGSDDVVGICEAYEEAPLFTTKNLPVKVNDKEFLVQNSGLAIAIPVRYAISLLEKNKVATPGRP